MSSGFSGAGLLAEARGGGEAASGTAAGASLASVVAPLTELPRFGAVAEARAEGAGVVASLLATAVGAGTCKVGAAATTAGASADEAAAGGPCSGARDVSAQATPSRPSVPPATAANSQAR